MQQSEGFSFWSGYNCTLTTKPLKFSLKKQVPETTQNFFPKLWWNVSFQNFQFTSQILFILSHWHDVIYFMDLYEDWWDDQRVQISSNYSITERRVLK